MQLCSVSIERFRCCSFCARYLSVWGYRASSNPLVREMNRMGIKQSKKKVSWVQHVCEATLNLVLFQGHQEPFLGLGLCWMADNGTELFTEHWFDFHSKQPISRPCDHLLLYKFIMAASVLLQSVPIAISYVNCSVKHTGLLVFIRMAHGFNLGRCIWGKCDYKPERLMALGTGQFRQSKILIWLWTQAGSGIFLSFSVEFCSSYEFPLLYTQKHLDAQLTQSCSKLGLPFSGLISCLLWIQI